MNKQEQDAEYERLVAKLNVYVLLAWRAFIRPMWIVIILFYVLVLVCNYFDIHL